jgi:hypothetical protein
MSHAITRRDALWISAVGAAGMAAPGCGTLLYPERVGQPRCGPLDWKVVALDTCGLLLFFVPGVIGFAVDFYNGTIFLPACQCGKLPPADADRSLVAVSVPREELRMDRIAQIASRHARRRVQLTPGRYVAQKLANLERFWPAHNRLASV